MGLFGGKKRESTPLILDEELFPPVNYDTVMNWLLGLSAKEYSQILQVANIQRTADEEAAKVLGKPIEPTSFIDDPKDQLQTIEPIFLMDDEPKKPKAKK